MLSEATEIFLARWYPHPFSRIEHIFPRQVPDPLPLFSLTFSWSTKRFHFWFGWCCWSSRPIGYFKCTLNHIPYLFLQILSSFHRVRVIVCCLLGHIYLRLLITCVHVRFLDHSTSFCIHPRYVNVHIYCCVIFLCTFSPIHHTWIY